MFTNGWTPVVGATSRLAPHFGNPSHKRTLSERPSDLGSGVGTWGHKERATGADVHRALRRARLMTFGQSEYCLTLADIDLSALRS